MANPYIPTTVVFETENLEARNKFEEIVRSHGYNFRYVKNIHNKDYIVIDIKSPLILIWTNDKMKNHQPTLLLLSGHVAA